MSKSKSNRDVFTRPGGSTANQGNKIVSSHFRISGSAYSAAATSGTTTVYTPVDFKVSNFGARGVAMGDLYSFYRIVDFKAQPRLHPGILNVNAQTSVYMPGNCSWYVGVAFEPSTSLTAPTTLTQFVDFPHLKWTNDDPSAKLGIHIGRKELLSSMPYEWLKTTATGVQDEDAIQLSYWILSVPAQATNAVSIMEVVYDIVVEFRGEVDPALNPLDWKFSSKVEKKEEKRVVLEPEYLEKTRTGWTVLRK